MPVNLDERIGGIGCATVAVRSVGRIGLALLVVLAASCGDDAETSAGPYRVGTRSVTFVDETRETPAFGGAPATDHRELVTEIWYPAKGPADRDPAPDLPAADGPFPVVVFNHGQQGEPVQYAPSFERWARAGYVVAAPRHPISVRGGPGGQFEDDIAGEVGDTPFVITSLAEQLPNLVDVDHVAVAGHSSGSVVAYASAFNTCCHDERVDAVLAEGYPAEVPLDGEYDPELRGTPVMFMYGSLDNFMPAGRTEFDRAEPPKYFLTLEGGDHSEVYRSGERSPEVAAVAKDFFDAHLRGDEGAIDRLRDVDGMEAEP
jgi:dienelactone hydrolase